MRQTRRDFLGSAAVLAALSTGRARAAAPPAPVRQSLTAFSTNAGRVASLRKGVAAMKALPGSDRHSWFFWGAVHAYDDALFEAEADRDPRLRSVDGDRYWNKCPHFGQSSADFAIWHRAYLHFFERHLRAAAGDSTLALPYWDYGSDAGRTFPSIYAAPYLDRAKTQPNPLYHPNRDLAFARGVLQLSAAIGQAPKTVAAETFFSTPGATGFGGDILDSDHTEVGLLEQRPHNDIHLAVGGVVGDANGAMAQITTAAFDPVFWVHHANVDRMWTRWASTPGKSWGPLPPSSWFDEKPWVFVDVDGRDVRVSRRDAIAMTSVYDVDYPNRLPLPSAPMAVASVAPDTERAMAAGAAPPMTMTAPMAQPPMAMAPPPKRARPPARAVLADATPIVVSPVNAARRQIAALDAPEMVASGPPMTAMAPPMVGSAAPPRGGSRETPMTAAPPPPAEAMTAPDLSDGSKVLLELAGITFRRVPSSGFAVYLDSVGAAPSADPVGLIDIFGATHGIGMRGMAGMMEASQRFDVTKILRRSDGPYTLRVEPYTLLVDRAQEAVRSRTDAIRIASIRFVVVG